MISSSARRREGPWSPGRFLERGTWPREKKLASQPHDRESWEMKAPGLGIQKPSTKSAGGKKEDEGGLSDQVVAGSALARRAFLATRIRPPGVSPDHPNNGDIFQTNGRGGKSSELPCQDLVSAARRGFTEPRLYSAIAKDIMGESTVRATCSSFI